MEKENSVLKNNNVIKIVLSIYTICFIFRILEYFLLRTDETIIMEAIGHKIIGILILYISMKNLKISFRDIGFLGKNSFKNLLKGLAFGISMFIIAYLTEIIIISMNGKFEGLKFYVTSYDVDKNIGYQTSVIFFIICILGNIVNVVMEEGIFRGLFTSILYNKYKFIICASITSTLFGLWHVVAPIRSFIDNDMSFYGMIANIIMLVVTSTLVGFKFSLLTKMTGNLYMAIGDHFINNTITNLLHVATNMGTDELMIIRLTIAQSLSCIIVLIYYLTKYKKDNKIIERTKVKSNNSSVNIEKDSGHII